MVCRPTFDNFWCFGCLTLYRMCKTAVRGLKEYKDREEKILSAFQATMPVPMFMNVTVILYMNHIINSVIYVYDNIDWLSATV